MCWDSKYYEAPTSELCLFWLVRRGRAAAFWYASLDCDVEWYAECDLGTEYGEWAGNIFALQLLPVDDKNTIELAMDFMKQAWRVFG